MNIEQARTNMLTQQIRTWGVLNQHVLDIIAATPREKFVPEVYRNLAYADMAIPLPHDQVMLAPKEEARLLQALNIKPTDVVLEIGTGTGYMTALLACLAKQVYSVDIFADFTVNAKQKLHSLNIANVALITADAARGWEREAPYDVIAITGSSPLLPASFRQSLKPGGRLFAILGDAPAMEATLITRSSTNEWSETLLFETVVPPLINALAPSEFVF
jgi:protein-L-isoaspartate(D-aspartate) O-methyltransferase